jgi:hypothetical protein
MTGIATHRIRQMNWITNPVKIQIGLQGRALATFR